MKRIVIYILTVLPLFTNAQFSVGLKGGVDINKFVSSKQQFHTEAIKLGVTGGLFFRIQNKSFFVQPELDYSHRNGNYSYTNMPSNHDTVFTNKIGYIDIVVIAGLRIGKHFRIGTGPVLGLLNSDNVHYNVQSNGASISVDNTNFNKVNFCWQAGICIDVAHFCFDIRYEYGVSRVVNSFNLPNSNITLSPEARNSLWQYTVGIRI